MPENILHERIDFDLSGAGALVGVSSESSPDADSAKILVEIQIFSRQIGEESATFTLYVDEAFHLHRQLSAISAGGAYAACVIAQVGAHIWQEYLDCKTQVMNSNPNGTWRQIHSQAIQCLAQRRGGIIRSLQAALISCTPAIIT
ncbi:hypothetical protein K9U40_13725 [Xanthobacter autotrophicus]|uniref:hypothetical protein n=1 Tax=Xanthobacter TaxID=279 RepID=UPI0024AC2643|nr:hypothetical protein [Xanthobacter autotrophicus]MDI4665379.1 hypothetical protein [Xanthobacter autotrophicus]